MNVCVCVCLIGFYSFYTLTLYPLPSIPLIPHTYPRYLHTPISQASTDPGWSLQPIVAFKGVKVGDYGGRSLSLSQNGFFLMNPDIPEGRALYDYMSNQEGGLSSFQATSLSAGGRVEGGNFDPIEKRKTAAEIKNSGLGRNEKPDWCTFKGSVTFLKHDTQPW